jgi:hypothetical protein
MAKRGRGGPRRGLKRKPDELDSVVADDPVGVSLERGPNKHPRSAEAGSAKTCALRSHGNAKEPWSGIEASDVSFQVLDDNGSLLDDEAVKCPGDQGSLVHNETFGQESLFGGSIQPTYKAAGSDIGLDLMTSFVKDDVFNTRLIEGAGKKIAPVVLSQSGVGCLLAATSFDASLLGSFGGFDCESLSMLVDFFSITMQYGHKVVVHGLMDLAVGMRQAVDAYSIVSKDFDLANKRFEIAFKEKSIAEHSLGRARMEITGLKVWVGLKFLRFELLTCVAGVG